MSPLSLYFLFNLIFLTESRSPFCLDENGHQVDWFVIYKLPRLTHHPNVLVQKGEAYLYITNNSITSKGEWILSQNSINDSKSLVAQTLSPQNTLEDDWLGFAYNDQPPNGQFIATGGHAKGAVFASSLGGFWLVHSVPHLAHFPYKYPRSGTHFGQSMLCTTLDSQQLEQVGHQLLIPEIHVFWQKIPLNLESIYPNLTSVARNVSISSPSNHIVDLFPKEKGSFRVISKSPHFGKDLYSDLVAVALKSNLYVESWQNGPGVMPSNCSSPYHVENISHMQFLDRIFSSHLDHSKLAISSNQSFPWICIGDINRMYSQEERGGGTICIEKLQLWTIYSSNIVTVESCTLYMGVARLLVRGANSSLGRKRGVSH